jgi:hypothetical protein
VDIFANALARQQSEQALQRAVADVTRLKRQLEAECLPARGGPGAAE